MKASSSSTTLRFIDIGANLLDDRFIKGVYRGSYRHETDIDCVMERCIRTGVKHIILTAGTVTESREAMQKAREWNRFYPDIHFSSTVGVHPTRCQQVFLKNREGKSPEDLLTELLEIARDGMSDGTVVAVGEIGLDYDRLTFCPSDVQKEYLVKQLHFLAKPTGLPLFLHNRNVGTDMYDILMANKDSWTAGGVVHSFDDTLDLALRFIHDSDLYIGLNGCSLRSEASLGVVKGLPLDRILLETDCPYCEVRPTHPGYRCIQTLFDARPEMKFQRGKCVKSRQEPCHIIQVAEVVAAFRGMPLEDLADACYQNTIQCFYPDLRHGA